MFFWSLKSIMKAFNVFLPDVDQLFREGEAFYNTEKEIDFISQGISELQEYFHRLRHHGKSG